MLNIAHVACNSGGGNQRRGNGDRQFDLCSLMTVARAMDQDLAMQARMFAGL